MTYEEFLQAEVLETFGGITPQALRDSPPQVIRDAIEAAWAVNAQREISLANTIRVAVTADAETWREWIHCREELIPKPPKREEANKYVAALNADPGAIMRVVNRLSR